MTGRELILYILENNLEDEAVFEDGRFIGFMTIFEAAERMNVGVPTVQVWISQGKIEGELIGDMIYIPANFIPPIEEDQWIK